MIHTAEFYIDLSKADLIIIKKYYIGELYSKITDFELGFNKTDGIRCTINKGYANYSYNKGVVWRAHIYVNFQELLKRPKIIPEDTKKIMSKINGYVKQFSSGAIILSRMDYKFDATITDSNIRKILLKLYKKCIDKRYFMIKNKRYKNSLRYTSKSRCDSIYDKECERIDKSEQIKDYEKNVLRFEAQIKRNHIFYKYKKYSLARSIKEYLNYELYQSYMNNMIVKVIRKGDYYSLYHASKLINKSELRDKDKGEIIKFMKKVSKCGMTEAKKLISDYKFNKYLSLLEKLNINPVLIPKQLKVTHITNPLKDLYSKEI